MYRILIPLARPTLAVGVTALGLAGLVLVAPAKAGNTSFDLGFDVSDIANSPLQVRTFMAALRPEVQRKVEGSCATYLSEPNSAQARETLTFCSLALVGVQFDSRTFATTAPRVRQPPDDPIVQYNPVPHTVPGYQVFPGLFPQEDSPTDTNDDRTNN